MDLSKLSAAELAALDMEISRLIEKHGRKERETAIERIYAVAHSLGMPLAAILKGTSQGASKTRRKGQKYQDPKNPANIWAGSGPRPAWLKAALAAGIALETLRA